MTQQQGMLEAQREILDAVQIMIDKAMEKTTQVQNGLITGVNTSMKNCTVTINGNTYTLRYYGGAPVVNYGCKVVIPSGNMSMAFVIA